MNKGDIVFNKIFGYGSITEISEDSAVIKFYSLKTNRTIKIGFFEKVDDHEIVA